MNKSGNTVSFGTADLNFVQKFGIDAATDMVLDYSSTNRTPFIYDTHQLASFLRLTHRQLFKLVRQCHKHYMPITLTKKNGGERKIYSPDCTLKFVQSCILSGILSKIPVSKYATAYKKRCNLINNATPHTNKRYILKLDIVDFFGSIRFEQVYNAAFNKKLYPLQIGVMLTKLCCHKDALPQGAPTSPALSNLVMKHFDDVMGSWCESRGISYTRYSDDMVFSSDKPLYVAYVKAQSMLENMGFEINEKKTVFITNANRQSVTGLTVNQKVSVSREYKRRLRQEIFYAVKFGIKDSILKSNNTVYISEKGADSYKYYLHLLGQVQFVLQIEPDNKQFKEALEKLRSINIMNEAYN